MIYNLHCGDKNFRSELGIGISVSMLHIFRTGKNSLIEYCAFR